EVAAGAGAGALAADAADQRGEPAAHRLRREDDGLAGRALPERAGRQLEPGERVLAQRLGVGPRAVAEPGERHRRGDDAVLAPGAEVGGGERDRRAAQAAFDVAAL